MGCERGCGFMAAPKKKHEFEYLYIRKLSRKQKRQLGLKLLPNRLLRELDCKTPPDDSECIQTLLAVLRSFDGETLPRVKFLVVLE